MSDIDQILRRHKVPEISALMREYVYEALDSDTFDYVPPRDVTTTTISRVKFVVVELGFKVECERTKDGMFWVNFFDASSLCGNPENRWISGLGYASSEEDSFYLAFYDALDSNEIYQTDLFKDIDF